MAVRGWCGGGAQPQFWAGGWAVGGAVLEAGAEDWSRFQFAVWRQFVVVVWISFDGMQMRNRLNKSDSKPV